MLEDTMLEKKKHFVSLVGRLFDFEDLDPEAERLLREIIEFGIYQLNAIDISHLNVIIHIPENRVELIKLYLQECVYAVTGDYDNAIKYRDAQKQLIQNQELFSEVSPLKS